MPQSDSEKDSDEGSKKIPDSKDAAETVKVPMRRFQGTAETV